MNVDVFADRLTRLLAQAPYRLERAPIRSVDDGLRWARDWHTPEGRCLWMGASDSERRRFVKWALWLRWQHRAAITARGGLTDGE